MSAPVSRLGRQIAEVTATLRSVDACFDESMPAPADPFQALDDLMAVVEALCPIWPSRDTFRNDTLNRL